MFRPDNENYVFSASAIAVSASITRPVRDFLTEQTSAVLSPSGGYAFQSRDKTNFREMIRTGHVSATVIGERGGAGTDSFSTLATVTIENLDILGFIKADAIVSRVAVSAPKVQDGDAAMHPSLFMFQGSAYHGLTINGTAYQPTLSNPFKDFPNDIRYRRTNGTVEVLDPSGEKPLYIVNSDGSYQLLANSAGQNQLFTGVPYAGPNGLLMEVKEFGRIFLGQLDVFKGKATVSMLHVELGCAAEGSLDCSTTASNGHDGT